MVKRRFDAAIAKLKTYSQVDQSKVAAIGYCFGGSMVLNMAKLGEDLKGVVSFHGVLQGVPPNKDLNKAAYLVLTGASDPMVPKAQVDKFKHEMDSAGIKVEIISYPGATHAFTNPKATEIGNKFGISIAYNAAADSASFKEMKQFFGQLF
jgi:dienelactone hydrolase